MILPSRFQTRGWLLFALSTAAVAWAEAAEPDRPDPLEGARREIYKRVGDVELGLHIFAPETHQASDRRAAAVFFFGGGWSGGTVEQFVPHCRYLASRGMVGIVADYRVARRHNTTPFECVKDARSAVRWIRGNARRLGIDPERIAAGGGSAGGHIAAATATIDGVNEDTDDLGISPRPDALLLFNPVYDNGPDGYGYQRFGDRFREISPRHNIRKGMPPAIVFLGTSDPLIPVKTARSFQTAMHEVGARSELFLYEGQPHGFFNHTRFRKDADPRLYYQTVLELDRFLGSLGFVEGPPTLKPPRYSVDHGETHLDVRYGGRRMARYEFAFDASSPKRRRETYKPFLHVFGKRGQVPITKGPGGQYTHHRGIFLGFSRTSVGDRSFDMRHMKQCVQVHQGFAAEPRVNDDGAVFSSNVAWQRDGGETLIREQRMIELKTPPDWAYAKIAMTSRLTAVGGDVVLDGDPEHAGAQFRPADEIVAAETEYFFHEDGIDPRRDRDLPWVGETFRVPSGRYSVVVLNHPDNPRQTRFSAYRDYGRFGAFPVLEMALGETETLRYCWIVASGNLPAREAIQQAAQQFANSPDP